MANALAANKAATFSAARHAGDDYATAAGKAFVADQGARADLLSGNYFQNHQVTADANARQNLLAAPRAGYLTSLGNKNNADAGFRAAEADVLIPSQAARNAAAGRLTDAQAGQVTATTPAAVDNLIATAEATRAGGRLKGAQADQVAAGGELTKSQLAAAQKQLQQANARIRFLEQRLTVRYKDALGDGAAPAAPAPDADGYVPLTPGAAANAEAPPAAAAAAAAPPPAPPPAAPRVFPGAGSRPLATPSATPAAPVPSPAAPGIMPGAQTSSLPIFGPGNVRLAAPGAAPAAPATATAAAVPIHVNPQTGERIQWNGSAWVPAP
jgi:hypothetical protein